MIATDDAPAEWSHYSPCTLLMDADGDVLAKLPLGAWAALLAWHRNLHARPLRFRDDVGQVVSVDRRVVASIIRRDLDAVVVLEQRDRERVWSEDDA